MRMLPAILLTTLTSCSSIEIIHEPVGCEGQPVFPPEIAFTPDDVEGANKAMVDKFKKRIVILRERINSQCAINKDHDKIHD